MADATGDLRWTKDHRTAADEDFDRLAEERIEKLRQRLDRYNAAIAEATSSGSKAPVSAGDGGAAGKPRPLPEDVLVPPTVGSAAHFASLTQRAAAMLQQALQSGNTAHLPPPPSDDSPEDAGISAGAASTDFELDAMPPSSSDGPASKSKSSERLSGRRLFASQETFASAGRGASVGSRRGAAVLEPQFDEVDASEARLSFGVRDDAHSETDVSPAVRLEDMVAHEALDEGGDDNEELLMTSGDEVDTAAAESNDAAPLTEREYHDWQLASRAAEAYINAQSTVGPHLFADIKRCLRISHQQRDARHAMLRDETLLASRQEETLMQIDDVVRLGADVSKQLQLISELRFTLDTERFTQWEQRIEAKRSVADEKMNQLQHDIVLVDRRRAHIHAMEAHGDAKQRTILQRQEHIAAFRAESTTIRDKLQTQLKDVEQRETRVAQWTEILSRREAALNAREDALRPVNVTVHHHDANANPPPMPPPRFKLSTDGPARAKAERLMSPDAVGVPATFASRPLPREEINVHLDDIDESSPDAVAARR
jgi:tRNA(Leu) C34 or U34 (ribose-2'-O)-methylase TrmL